jgi:3-isopropylmalate/(R)-2-methylmalate dehydratase large subunit
VTARTMVDKIWDDHVIVHSDKGQDLVYVDLNFIHEGGAFLGFDQLRMENRSIARPLQTIGFTDHYIPTKGRELGFAGITNPEIRFVVEALDANTREFNIHNFHMHHVQQGITHVIAPELGLTQPGMLITCIDSHTATNGAVGALGMPIGSSNQLKHVFATQTVWMKRPKTMRVSIDGPLGHGVTAKDVILAMIRMIGVGGATGFAIEYCGSTIAAMPMDGRFTICNMSIEAGARLGAIAPDDTTIAYLADRPLAPTGTAFEDAEAYWRSLRSDAQAHFDHDLAIDASTIAPMVSWGTSPEDCAPIDEVIPDPSTFADRERRRHVERALEYMDLLPGTVLSQIPVDRVFIGSCTNSRIEDLRLAASVLKGRRAVVPGFVAAGSATVKRQAEAEGLHNIFTSAGLEWRDPGCAMCNGSNGELVPRGERCASTTNRNFEGRQGPGARTHIMSPAMVAAAAVTGRLTDVRRLMES